MFNKRYRIDFWSFMTFVALIFFGLFLIYPITHLVTNAFQSVDNPGHFSLSNFVKFVSTDYYRQAIWNSIKVTIVSTILASVIGVSLAYITTNIKIFGSRVINVLIVVSMFSPPFIGAYSWILMFGRAGSVTKFFASHGIKLPSIYGFTGIMIVFTLHLFIYIYMYTKGALKKVDATLIEAAESLGDHGLKKVLKVSLPLVTPTILAGGAIVFLRAFADYGTPRLIGEGFTTMPVLVYNEWLSEEGSDAFFSSSIAFVMILVAIVVFLLQMHFSRKNYNMSMLNPPVAKKITGIGNIAAHFYVYLVTFLALLPVLYCTVLSFREVKHGIIKDAWTLKNYVDAWNKMGSSLVNTLKFALAALVFIVIFGTMFAYITVRRRNVFSRVLDTCAQIPYVLSGVIFGLMLLICYNNGIGIPMSFSEETAQRIADERTIRILGHMITLTKDSLNFLALGGTGAIIVIAYIVRRMPYTLRSSASILRQMNPGIEEASMSLGYGSVPTFFNITMPVMTSGIISGAILSWITLIQELSSTLMLYSAKTATLSVSLFHQVSRGAYGVASALSTMLIVMVVGSMLLFFRLTGNADIDM
ncbi:iron ABC transporter permease [Anaerolineaceae bacterium oral taxon 439]|nr:iron ABC transporter permease [Anaerolineaceae bacterium oral taxon 439]